MTRASLVNLGDGFAARVAPGDGDAVLWVHGYTLDSSSWGRLWELLPGWHHLGIDLPGHGASLPLRAGEDVPSLARRLGELAFRHEVRHLVALSFGTLIALQLAIEFPTAFRTLVLAAPTLGGGPEEEDVARRYEELAAAYRERGFGGHLRELWMRSPPDLFRGAEARPELWRELWALVGQHPWWELADGAFGRLSQHVQTPSQLRRIRAATLVLVGDRELPAFKRSAELIRRSIPAARRVYVPEAGHLNLLEDPQRARPLIDDHLRAHARRTPDPAPGRP